MAYGGSQKIIFDWNPPMQKILTLAAFFLVEKRKSTKALAHALHSDQYNAVNSGHYVVFIPNIVSSRPIGCLYNMNTNQLSTNTNVVFVYF